MKTDTQYRQRLLFLQLKLKHKFTIIEFINLAEINAEMKVISNYLNWII